MLYQTELLCPKRPKVTLTSYVCDHAPNDHIPPRPAIIVCPGGSYRGLAKKEGEPVVRQFLAAGFNAYLLRYSVGEDAANYNPLVDVALAICYVRKHAESHHSDPNRVFTCGFSAGGHLAASAGVLWNIPEVREAIGVDSGLVPEGFNRPNGMILCYPVITAGDYAHKNSIYYLCGTKTPTEEEKARFSLECLVDPTTPPAFLWHTVEDKGVSVRNSLLMMNALLSLNIPFESHIFPKGPHGLSLATKETWEGNEDYIVPHVAPWIDLAIRWVQDMF